MTDDRTTFTRRTALELASVAVAGGVLAGCLDDSASNNVAESPTNGTGDADGTSTNPGTGADAADDDAAEDTDEAASEAEDSSDGERAETTQGVAIEPGTAIQLDGQTAGWEGIAPSPIEGAVNPTLILQEGETYEIGWTTGDGAHHNIEIRNENDETIDDLQTEVVSEPEEQWLEFEASSEMATYICKLHEVTMVGEIVIVDSDVTVVESDTTTDEETDDTTDTVGKTIELEPGADIRFSGQTVSWEGLSPAALEGEANPTLVLQEGGRYSIGWTEGDGAMHKLQICNDSGDVVNGLETPMVAEPGKDQILEFTARSEMTQYRCEPHQITMVGTIQVE